MDFGRVLEAILEGFWMPESMQKSIEFWMDSGRGSGMILASKVGSKSLQKLIERVLKTLISCGGYCKNEGTGPWRFNRNVFKNSFENSLHF